MAILIDEPRPISRGDATSLLGTVTSLGVVASRDAGVLSQSYIGGFYGSEIAKAGEKISLNPNNIMSVLDYAGRLVPAFSFAVKDATTTDGSSPSGAFRFRIAMDVITTPQTGTASTFSFGLSQFDGFFNPFGNPTSIPAGGFPQNRSVPMPHPYDCGYTGARFQIFGEKVYNITKANLIAGQLPSFNVKLKIWFAWLGTPPPTGVLQIAYTPVYNDNSIVLPPNYYRTPNAPRGKPVTNRDFTFNNLARLPTPYNILPTPFAGAPLAQFSTGGTIPAGPTALNGFNDEGNLQAFYRQSPTVALGGPSYQYVAGDAFPVSALVMDTDLNIKAFPPLYYVYGVDEATSIVNFTYPSYSTNPLDSRP